jgi:hypothetical protein
MTMRLSPLRLLIGRPVANREAESRKLGVLAGVAAMGLDALSSAAYGPEAALILLAAAGAVGLGQIVPVTRFWHCWRLLPSPIGRP